MIGPRFGPAEYIWKPRIDIYETPGEIIVLIDIAGVRKEDIRLDIGRSTLKIYGMRREKELSRQVRYRLAEIPYGYFERSLSFPVPVDTDSAAASYRDGLLQVSIAKMSADNFHKIRIQKG
jgi:HSP20 family protein